MTSAIWAVYFLTLGRGSNGVGIAGIYWCYPFPIYDLGTKIFPANESWYFLVTKKRTCQAPSAQLWDNAVPAFPSVSWKRKAPQVRNTLLQSATLCGWAGGQSGLEASYSTRVQGQVWVRLYSTGVQTDRDLPSELKAAKMLRACRCFLCIIALICSDVESLWL